MVFNPQVHKNIIFDLGGVLVNIDYTVTTEAFKKLGAGNFDELFSKAKQNSLFDRYEKGEITSAVFRDELRVLLQHNYSDDILDTAWNAMLLDFPEERFGLLEKLRKNHRLFLLSNTNEIHIHCFYKYLYDTYRINDLSNYFDSVYLSYKVGMRKPDTEIFELLLKENGLLANETFFIDDSAQHIEGALKTGLQAYWLDLSKETVLDIFK